MAYPKANLASSVLSEQASPAVPYRTEPVAHAGERLPPQSYRHDPLLQLPATAPTMAGPVTVTNVSERSAQPLNRHEHVAHGERPVDRNAPARIDDLTASLSHGADYQEQISYGCKLVQRACTAKVLELEKELSNLQREVLELRTQAEGLHNRNTHLETELADKRKKSQAQMEDNRAVAQQAISLRQHLQKLGRFKDTLGEAFSQLDRDGSGGLTREEFAAARTDYHIRTDFAAADANHDGVVSRQERR
eukprot:TRINITY_DN4654_c0_g1_i6.p1 TRINITY_DN4654_c0_g1~~TRINITY_DN4654_c0_g1_i6.p1  ORF type:complete len:283 (+),score=35.05 TRINITY_DN4654_c0_g1_i6:103-849(+)